MSSSHIRLSFPFFIGLMAKRAKTPVLTGKVLKVSPIGSEVSWLTIFDDHKIFQKLHADNLLFNLVHLSVPTHTRSTSQSKAETLKVAKISYVHVINGQSHFPAPGRNSVPLPMLLPPMPGLCKINSPTNKSSSFKFINTLREPRGVEPVPSPVIGGAVVGLLCAILVVMFIVYRMRKKDEGSYALDEPKRSPTANTYAKNANNREFYA
ncbi:conserved hypothetical protein [Culex quinquefasciatus]|uniref:Syndecan n=1 Tax=Culex quinquefasciatus TaxID=7176 RepID=B0XGW9_CULQU|nr:conserved hypothetical protein [Culex quinquefasciatus]|eukprot:XP_001868891.1 conserved hypothetical protein [Culex quinquefasciatus]